MGFHYILNPPRILFEVGIPNLFCGCILGWWSVLYHFQVTVTWTADLVSSPEPLAHGELL